MVASRARARALSLSAEATWVAVGMHSMASGACLERHNCVANVGKSGSHTGEMTRKPLSIPLYLYTLPHSKPLLQTSRHHEWCLAACVCVLTRPRMNYLCGNKYLRQEIPIVMCRHTGRGPPGAESCRQRTPVCAVMHTHIHRESERDTHIPPLRGSKRFS